MRIAMLAPIARRTSPVPCGPRERMVALLVEGLVAAGIDVTVIELVGASGFDHERDVRAGDSLRGKSRDPKVLECLRMSELFEKADDFDLIHNHHDFVALSYSGLVRTPVVTTIHGLCSQTSLSVYKKYDGRAYYVSVSDADRSPELSYVATVHHGIDVKAFPFNKIGGDYLLFSGQIQARHGAGEAVGIAKHAGKKIVIAGAITDRDYFEREIEPAVDGDQVQFLGTVPPERRISLLGSALAVLHPVGCEDPFGLSVLEANACGTPVIAFPHGSVPEIITDGVNGFLARDLLEAAEAVGRISAISRIDCRRLVEKRFSRDRMVEDYLQVYARVLEETKREDHRPWGYYEVLADRPDHKVKRIVVHPGKRLSLQRHTHRAEHWTIISGSPVVTCNDDEIALTPGDSIDIPLGAKHRIFNPGFEPVVFIEVQTGDSFAESDIQRFEDDFGRVLDKS
ncbi:MAG: glycosyltransferase [Desulfomonile tiedjei]|nr:glycosyltransferase [Desulfomonile tiedjei]